MTGPSSRAERVYLELVAAYQTPILNYVNRLVGDLDLAEDLTQETFIRAYQALSRLELHEESAARRRGWLYRIAHNAATDHVRRQSRLRWLRLEPLRLGAGSVESQVVESLPVQQALNALNPADRELLWLFAHDGLDAVEVASVLGITHDAARKRRQRARSAFVAAYEKAVNGEV